MKAEDLQNEIREINGVKVEIRSYRISESYYCHLANADPGATIARAEGSTRDEAVNIAVEKAHQRLSRAPVPS